MKVKRLKISNLRNAAHQQFHTEVRDVCVKQNLPNLNLVGVVTAHSQVLAQEVEAMQYMYKSATTRQMEDADEARDVVYRGLSDLVKPMRNHFDAAKAKAAERVWVVIDNKGNVPSEEYNAETADISNLVAELRGKYAADITLLGITDWVNQLDTLNKNFDALFKSRYSESSAKTQLRMKKIRPLVDDAFRALTERIDALALINGVAIYQGLINELNARIDKYDIIIAVHKGRLPEEGDENNPPAPPAR